MPIQQLTRYSFVAVASVASTLALISCLEPGGANNVATGGAGGATSSAGGTTPSAGGASSSAGGTTSSAGGTTSSAGGTTSSAGGTTSSTGGTSSSAGGTSAGTGGTGEPCTNVQHPDHMDKECSIWAEWDSQKPAGQPLDCDAAWLTGAGYCLESCGKCQGGSGGSSNGGSSSGSSNGGSSSGSSNGGSTSSGGGPGPDLPDINDGTVHWASRYWDCCKPHCAQFGMPSCGQDGVSSNTGNSACSGGSAYACYNEAPRAVGTEVSYGYVAVPNPSCGTCYHLQFTGTGEHNQSDPGSQAIAGKHMIVKVTNTGGDVGGNQFDLMIPGGGVGQNPNTCPTQWNANSGDLGPMYGGFLAACGGTHDEKKNCVRQKCNLIPAGDARDGCIWFVDWMQVADNPQFRYEPINCPSDL